MSFWISGKMGLAIEASPHPNHENMIKVILYLMLYTLYFNLFTMTITKPRNNQDHRNMHFVLPKTLLLLQSPS